MLVLPLVIIAEGKVISPTEKQTRKPHQKSEPNRAFSWCMSSCLFCAYCGTLEPGLSGGAAFWKGQQIKMQEHLCCKMLLSWNSPGCWRTGQGKKGWDHLTLQLIQEKYWLETLGTYIVTPLPDMEIKLAAPWDSKSAASLLLWLKKLGSF